MNVPRLILGSRSPRRRELLELLVSPESIDVRPPRSSDELGFEGLTSWLDIAQRLQQIAREKNADVLAQLEPIETSCLVLTADTTIVASDANGCYRVLGQPPDDDSWQDVVRGWFRDLYAGRSHIAATAVCLTDQRTGRRLERIAQSQVWFRDDVEPLLDWYLATDEPRGKAGGYALQGAAAAFIRFLSGSPSNIIGLPLHETAQLLQGLGYDHNAHL